MASRRVHYDASMKRKAILYAEESGNRAAARKFDTDEKNIRRWREQRDMIFACKSSTKSFTGPKKGRYPEVEDSVAQFVRDARSKAVPVTIQMLQCKAEEDIHKLGIENFKASRGWCEKFMRREGFSLRQRTSICQKRPADFADKLVQFQRPVIGLRKRYAHEFKHIGNADETPLYFDMPRNYTVNSKVSELICEIERQELEERINASQRSAQINRKSDPSVIEKEHETYVKEHKSQFNALIRDVQQRVPVETSIKEEVSTSEETSDITDISGKVIGESTLKIGRSSDVELMNIKEEFSESLLKDVTENIKSGVSGLSDKKSDFEKSSQLPFRIKKEVPTVKMKEESTSLLDMTRNQGFTSDPSSLDDFETGKMSVNTYQKKKNARRLSTDEKGSQRKK